MNNLIINTKIRFLCISIIIAGVLFTTTAVPVFSHGGKNHGGKQFTSFLAAQKASQLYDQLLDSGKLSGEWETDLTKIKISTRNSSKGFEYVVQFERLKGDPGSVYFFFHQDGQYAGSNFTGK